MKKIVLNKETVRKLNDKDLEYAQGGKPPVPCNSPITLVHSEVICITDDTCVDCETDHGRTCGPNCP